MPQSFSSILVHVIFSTKNRENTLNPELSGALYAYLAVVLHDHGCAVVQIGGFEDHVHLLFGLPRTQSISQIVDILKSNSTRWIKRKDTALSQFHWQSGYGAFSVSDSNSDAVTKYIVNQHEHHRKTTFQEEYRQFLDRHKIQYDERYLWD